MNAVATALRDMFADQQIAMREVVHGLSAEALNWKPLDGKDTNSIAQMLSHALDAERSLVAGSVGITLERDRESHFSVEVSSADEFIAQIDATTTEVYNWLGDLTDDALASTITRGDTTRTGAWMAIHALEHAREHIGQALLTRQLIEAGQS